MPGLSSLPIPYAFQVLLQQLINAGPMMMVLAASLVFLLRRRRIEQVLFVLSSAIYVACELTSMVVFFALNMGLVHDFGTSWISAYVESMQLVQLAAMALFALAFLIMASRPEPLPQGESVQDPADDLIQADLA